MSELKSHDGPMNRLNAALARDGVEAVGRVSVVKETSQILNHDGSRGTLLSLIDLRTGVVRMQLRREDEGIFPSSDPHYDPVVTPDSMLVLRRGRLPFASSSEASDVMCRGTYGHVLLALRAFSEGRASVLEDRRMEIGVGEFSDGDCSAVEAFLVDHGRGRFGRSVVLVRIDPDDRNLEIVGAGTEPGVGDKQNVVLYEKRITVRGVRLPSELTLWTFSPGMAHPEYSHRAKVTYEFDPVLPQNWLGTDEIT